MGKSSSGDIKVNLGDIGGIDTSSLKEMLGLEIEIREVGKEINKQKLTIKTNDKYLENSANKLNEIANLQKNFKFKEVRNNANLFNIDELRNKVIDFYDNEIPRLRNGLMELYDEKLIHPLQYDFFSQKLNELDDSYTKDRSLHYLDNYKKRVNSEIYQYEEDAKEAIGKLYSNINNGKEGFININEQRKKLSNYIDTLNEKNVGAHPEFSDRVEKLNSYFRVLNNIGDMTFAIDDDYSSRKFKDHLFDSIRGDLDAIGVDASELEGVLKQAFNPQPIENSSESIKALAQNINLLKETILEIKGILESISGSGENTSQLFDSVNKISQLFDNIKLGEEEITNPIQTIVQQLSELNNMDFSKIGESITTLQSTLSALPGTISEAFAAMNGLEINVSGLEKSKEELAAEAKLLQTYQTIYTKLLSTDVSSYAEMQADRVSKFDINDYKTQTEKIAAYEAQLNLIDKLLSTEGILNLDTFEVDKTKTWKDFVDKSLLGQLRGAKQSASYRRSESQKIQKQMIEAMQAGNIESSGISGNVQGAVTGDIKGNVTGDINGTINISNIEDLSSILGTIIEQLNQVAEILIIINNNMVDGLNFENSDPFASQTEGAEKLAEAEEKVAEAAQKAKQATSESGTVTSANATANVVEAETKAMQDAGEAARNAAEGKREFANANENAASTANATVGAAEAEASALNVVAEASEKVDNNKLDKRKTVYGPDDKPAFMAEVSSKKFANKYQTTTENYAWKADDSGIEDWHKQSEIIVDDFKKIQTEQANAQKKVELARNKLKSWFQSIRNQTFGKADYIGEFEVLNAEYGNDASGLTSINDIEKVLNGMEKVQARVKEIQREMTKGNTSSLNPWQNASIAESSLSTSVDELERDASRLKSLSPDISNAIKEIRESLGEFQKMTLDKGVDGKNWVDIDTYAKSFGDLALKIRETRTAIKDEKIFESTNAVYDPYSELEGQVKRYGTIAKRMTRSEISGRTSTDAYSKDAEELEATLVRIGQLEEQIRSRPFFDETKINSAAVKMSSIQKSLEDIRRQAELAGTKTSDMTKMTSDQFNENVKNYETMVRGWLEGQGFKPLDDSVIINFSNGIAKVSAQIKDADGNWRKFSADIDATGKGLLNVKTPYANAKEAVKYSNAESVSQAVKFDLSSFQSQTASIASTFKEKLTGSGYQILGDTPSVELLENGLARVSAKIKDVNGNWQQFSTTVDATGATINNATLKPITSNLENLERQLAGGTLASDFTNQATASFEKFFNKVKEGSAGFTEINQRMEEFRTKASQVTDAEGLAAYNKELSSLEESYKRFQTLARAAGKNSQMFLDDNGTPAKFGNIEEAVSAAKEYASTIGKIRNITGQIGSKQISEGGIGQFTIQVKTAEGEVRNLKFAYDDFANSMMSNAATKGFERTGLAGYLDRVQAKLQNLTAYWTAMMLNPYMLVGRVKEMVDTVVELDTALVDLKKTTTMSGADLNQFYFDANESAKELGVTTSEIISQAADWSRLGYSDKESATQMAELSSQFASISPGMDTGMATEGLVSTMKANINAFLYSNMQIECV